MAGPEKLISLAKNLLLIAIILIGVSLALAGTFTKKRVAAPQQSPLRADADIAQTVARVNAVFEKRWAESKIDPASPANHLTIIRRMSLGLAGTIPSVEEIRELEKVPEDQRLDWWTERLLADARTHDHLAERFARALVGVEGGPFIVYRRHRFVDWLSQQFANGQPYDAIARNVLTQSGLWTDTPGVNFYTVTANEELENNPDPIKLAAKTSRAFLAMRIDCLECHDDFLGTVQLGDPDALKGGEQIDFHHLAAFFGQVGNSFAGIQDRAEPPPYQFRLLEDDEPGTIDPAVPYLPELLPKTGTLRSQLAGWVTHPENLPFARATVNRLWAIVFGRSLVEPIDDIPWRQPLPEELDVLAHDFIEHGFDIQRTLRIMMQTRVFRLESVLPGVEVTPAHERHMAVFPVLRLRPEQMAGSLLQATSLKTLDSTAHVLNRVISFGQQNDFINRFGDFGADEFLPRGETVTQRLLMLNGSLISERVSGGLLGPGLVGTVAADPKSAVEVTFLACLTRYPTEDEIARFTKRQSQPNSGNQQSRIQDLYWVILNSAEFSWNH